MTPAPKCADCARRDTLVRAYLAALDANEASLTAVADAWAADYDEGGYADFAAACAIVEAHCVECGERLDAALAALRKEMET